MGKTSKRIRLISTFCYAIFFTVYLIIGFQPVEAINYEISGSLAIPSISINSDITALELKDNRLSTPDSIVGEYSIYPSKTLLIGHSTTIFKNLKYIAENSEIFYDEQQYIVKNIQTLAKDEINMAEILSKTEEKTIVIMTCAGELLDNFDATHRLIITAEIAK